MLLIGLRSSDNSISRSLLSPYEKTMGAMGLVRAGIAHDDGIRRDLGYII